MPYRSLRFWLLLSLLLCKHSRAFLGLLLSFLMLRHLITHIPPRLPEASSYHTFQALTRAWPTNCLLDYPSDLLSQIIDWLACDPLLERAALSPLDRGCILICRLFKHRIKF